MSQTDQFFSKNDSPFHFFFFFLGPHLWHLEVPRLRSILSCGCQRTPQSQPQPHQIWAMSTTCTTAHGNAGSLTHWVRLGVEPASSWILVGFASSVPQQELPSPFNCFDGNFKNSNNSSLTPFRRKMSLKRHVNFRNTAFDWSWGERWLMMLIGDILVRVIGWENSEGSWKSTGWVTLQDGDAAFPRTLLGLM